MPQRLNLTYRIRWRADWHVGSGFRTPATDRLIQRWGGPGGPPFLPGSQIKGVLRHTCERLALALGLDAVGPHAVDSDQQRQLVEHFRPLAQSTLIVDRLFGSRFQGDCLCVENALPWVQPGGMSSEKAKTNGAERSTVRTRTAMDRLTGTVKEEHLFTTELAGGLQELRGRIRARHAHGILTQDTGGFPYEYALLIAGLLSIDQLGGDKSAGLGRCCVEVDEILWNGIAMSLEEALACFEEADWSEMVQLIREESGQ